MFKWASKKPFFDTSFFQIKFKTNPYNLDNQVHISRFVYGLVYGFVLDFCLSNLELVSLLERKPKAFKN